MVGHQVVILFNHIRHLCRGKALGQNLRLRLDLLHEVTVLVDRLANLTLQVRPNLLLILNDVLCLVQLCLQILDLIFKLTHLIILVLFEVGQQLLEDEDLGLAVVALFRDLVDLGRHGCLPLQVGLKSLIYTFFTLCQSQKFFVKMQIRLQIFDLLLQLLVLFSVIVKF